ncbi:MAG: polysaccharide biosynthesis protein [Flavobacteriales bacterium]|nr:polysaccharide biosynthesis protein [Flavobacteriales bacterium]
MKALAKGLERLKKIITVLIGQGLNALISFLMMPYLARSLTKVDYANYGQTLLVVASAIAILAAGFNKSLFVFLADEKRDKDRTVSGNLMVGIGLSVLLSVLIYFSAEAIAAWFGNMDLVQYIRIYCWTCPFIIPYYALNSLLVFSDKVKESTQIAVISNLIKVSGLFVAIQFYASLTYVFYVLVAVGLLQFIWTLGTSYSLWSVKMKGAWKLGIGQLRIGLPLGLSAVMGLLITKMDGLMISTLMSQEAYAEFRNGAWEIPLIGTLYASISTIILPEVAKLYSSKNFTEIVRLKSLAIVNTAMVTVPILVFLLVNSKVLVISLFSSSYEASWPVFAIFNLTLLIRINDYSDILVSSAKTRFISYFYAISLSLNVILNLVFIHFWGIYGAAAATVLSIAVLAILQARKSIDILSTGFAELFRPAEILKVMLLSLLCIGFTYLITWPLDVSPLTRSIIMGLLYFPLIGGIFVKRKMFHPLVLEKLDLRRYLKK